MDFIKKGLNGFNLKILALIFMTFDHISSFLPYQLDIPIWFNWIGRLSAPLFIFMVVEGFYHTSNRKKYISRLYIWSIIMNIGNEVMVTLLPHPDNHIIINNIFATMFLITLFLLAIEWIRGRQFAKGIGLLLVPIVLNLLMFAVLGTGSTWLLRFFMFFIPTPLFVEGGIVLIGLGIGFYFFRGSHLKLSVFYSLFSLANLLIVAGAGITYENLFLLNFQWLMIFALPFMLLYNGQKGRSLKHFFYLYYPLHCYVLYALGIFLLK